MFFPIFRSRNFLFISARLSFLAFAVIFVLFPQSVSAQPATACDPEYMDALEARAWMEAQREISQNQNLIFKPDSVLDYTCFRSFLRHITATGTLFSDASLTATSIQAIVGESVTSYLGANFNHTPLGGRATVAYPAEGTSVYACSRMQAVWDIARCQNFQHQSQDSFYDFDWYTNDANDPRQLTSACAAAPGTLYTSALATAYNGHESRYTLSPDNNPAIADGTDYLEDTVTTYFNRILPRGATNPSGGPAIACSNPPIRTGVTVTRSGMSSYPDAVCPNPGCSYNPSGSGSCN